MNSKFSAKKACATLMMLMLIMSPLTSLGPKAAMAAPNGITIKSQTLSKQELQNLVFYFTILVDDGNGNYVEKVTIVDTNENGGDVIGTACWEYNTNGSCAKYWKEGDQILYVDVYERPPSGKWIARVEPKMFLNTAQKRAATIVTDGGGVVDDSGNVLVNGGQYNYWFNKPGTGENTDALLEVAKVWYKNEINNVDETRANRQVDIYINGSDVDMYKRLDGSAFPYVVTTVNNLNPDKLLLEVYENFRPSSNEVSREFIKAELTSNGGTIPNNAWYCDDEGICDVNTLGFTAGKTYTLTYYNLRKTPYPLEIPKTVDGVDILDWCAEFAELGRCDESLLLNSLKFDLFKVDESTIEWVGGECDDPDQIGCPVQDANIFEPAVAEGKIDGDEGSIIFDNGFITAGWYKIVESIIDQTVDGYFKEAKSYFVYIDENSNAWQAKGVEYPASFDNSGNLSKEVGLDVIVDVLNGISQPRTWGKYTQDIWDVYKQDVWDVYKQDIWDVYKQDVWDVYTQDIWDIYKQDIWDVYTQDIWDVYKQDIWDIYTQDIWDVYTQDIWDVYKQDIWDVYKQDIWDVYTQDYWEVWANDWYQIFAQDYYDILRPFFVKRVSSVNDTLVTWRNGNTVPGGTFKSNGMTYLKVNYADLINAEDGLNFTIGDSSPSNKTISYDYNIRIGADRKLHLTVGDDRFISASVTAKLYDSEPKNSDPSGHTTIAAGQELVVNLPIANAAPKATATKNGDDVKVEVAGKSMTTSFVKNGSKTVSFDGYTVVVEFNGNGVKSATVTAYPAVTVPDTGSFWMFVHFDSLKWYTTGEYEFDNWKVYEKVLEDPRPVGDPIIVPRRVRTDYGALVPDGTGQGALVPDGTGQGALVPDGTGEGALVPDGTGEGTLVPDGTGQGELVPDGTGQGELVPDGTGQGELVPDGTGQAGRVLVEPLGDTLDQSTAFEGTVKVVIRNADKEKVNIAVDSDGNPLDYMELATEGDGLYNNEPGALKVPSPGQYFVELIAEVAGHDVSLGEKEIYCRDEEDGGCFDIDPEPSALPGYIDFGLVYATTTVLDPIEVPEKDIVNQNKIDDVVNKNKIDDVVNKNKIDDVVNKNKIDDVVNKNKIDDVINKNKIDNVVISGDHLTDKIIEGNHLEDQYQGTNDPDNPINYEPPTEYGTYNPAR